MEDVKNLEILQFEFEAEELAKVDYNSFMRSISLLIAHVEAISEFAFKDSRSLPHVLAFNDIAQSLRSVVKDYHRAYKSFFDD